MPIYVRAGAIIPIDPIRQYTAELVNEPTTLRIFTGANGSYTLYEDDGISMDYLKGNFKLTSIKWDDTKKKLIVESKATGNKQTEKRIFKVELIPARNYKKR
jgi:alpha-glucosidase/alpha-D-xyloside xylohydrolase